MKINKIAASLALAGIIFPGVAMATNGMLMEGYGPISTGMGGTAMAYDNGAAGMANNPATLGLMAPGSRIDVMLGFVGPDVSGTVGESSADAFYMPAVGYATKRGDLAYGVGIYGQGGMGTEYANGDMAQIGVGRVIFPAAYAVNDRLNIGGSIDIVWAGADLVMGAAGINVQDDSDFTGAMKGYGLAAKLGFTYKLTDAVTLGGVYQTKGNLSDLKGEGYTIKGFDMPTVVSLGLAWQANDRLMVAADLKDILWSDTMNTVTIVTPGGAVPFQQNWNDQIVVALGLSYKLNDVLTGRAGYNYGKNPVPSEFVTYLWPAIVESHYTVGLGYAVSKHSELDFALSYAPEVTVTGTGPAMPAGNGGLEITHSQLNAQIMYSYKF